MQRRLAAILAADVVGYSKLMAVDEAGTLTALREHRKSLFDPETARHGGRIVKLMGDGTLVEFPSVVDAVQCALAIQNSTHDASSPIKLRIGINLGDIIIDGDDIYGDGVNIAARLEALAQPGGICIASIVHESLGNRIETEFSDAGEHDIKNIARPIRVFHWPANEQSRPPQSAKTTAPEKPSIAVLPFNNMSGDQEQEYFSDGLAEDIITELSRFSELFVIARNTTFTYKGKSVKVDEVCSELGVRYLLEGSVRKAGNRVRVNAQLIDGATEAHLWADRFDRDLDDIFAVQDEITQAIVTAVAPETISAELKRSQSKHPENLGAWEKLMQARWHLGKLTKQDNAAAKSLLESAIELAHSMAGSYSALAVCHLHDMLHMWRDDAKVAIALADEAARNAVSLDSSDAEAYAILGMTSIFAREFDDAFEYLERAIRINPNLANAYGLLCAAHGLSRQYDDSVFVIEHAMKLSPRDSSVPIWYAGWGISAYIDERYEECIRVGKMALRAHHNYASTLRQITASYGMLGKTDEATASLVPLLERMPDLTVSQTRQIVPFRYDEDQERFLEGLRRAGLPEE